LKRAVIGVGSPFGADRLGWQVVEQLQKEYGESAIDFLTLDRPGVALLEWMRGYGQVVLIDAVLVDEIGERPHRHLDREALIAHSTEKLSSHGSGIAEAVALGEVLGELPAEIELIGVAVTAQQSAVSPVLIQQSVERVVALLDE
jgi:hydrogenase maturation protease